VSFNGSTFLFSISRSSPTYGLKCHSHTNIVSQN
jgi:hypothetical protein